ncbi:hypothetical protein NM688_g2690 [Phlebia brevispora]|uniref:Uncharacterized protein n=1 Tax=Phlebia brevispora TaxID=194682 RepID=A0ACC1T7V6_9APHY|nr:hypothetical protein NM688_g2690 [Phlebia brevispora]
MGLLSYCALAFFAIAGVYAGELRLHNPRFIISASNGASLRAETLPLSRKPEALALGPTDSIKLSFGIVQKDGGKPVQPHQAFLRFYDEVTGEEGIQPLRVNNLGRVKYEFSMTRPPASLPPTSASNPLSVTLILGSFEHSPVKYELFDIYLPESQPPPQHPDEPTFHPLPEIVHTFRPEQKVPPKVISTAFAALVVAPWVVLLGLWAHIRPSVPHLFSLHIVPFTVSIAAFEGLLFWYWVDLRLGQVLLYGGIIGLVTAMTGKSALATKADWRLGKIN